MDSIRLLMISITVREEMVAPVIMSTSCSLPVPAPALTPSISGTTPRNDETKALSFSILSPRPGVSLLSSTFIPRSSSLSAS
jgi:hypothetical protein